MQSQKFKKIFKEVIDKADIKSGSYMGEKKMSEFIWHWIKGNSKVYTRKIDVAEKAMKEGIFVTGIKLKPRIVKY